MNSHGVGKVKLFNDSRRKNTPLNSILSVIPRLMFVFGLSALTIATMFDIAPSTIYYWVTRFKQSGVEGLKPKKRGRTVGSGRLLNPQQEEEIQRIIVSKEPDEYDIDQSCWSRRAIAELVYFLFKIKIAERTIGDYCKRWKFTSKVPTTRDHKRDPEKVKTWLNSIFPAIVAKAKEIGAEIYFGDETGFFSQALKNRSYAPVGQRATITKSGSRWVINAMVSITATGKMMYMTYTSSMTAIVFINYLKRLVKSANGRKVFLIVDNLRSHHAKIVNKWVQDHSDQI
jgi:transposase